MQFYKKFFPDCTGYEDFRNKLFKALNSITPNDRKAIMNFTSNRVGAWLQSAYDKNKKTVLTSDEETIIEFNLVGGDKAEEELRVAIKKELQSLVGIGSESVIVTSVQTGENSSHLLVKMGLNPSVLKAVINAALKKKLKPGTDSLDWFKSHILNSKDIVSLTSGNEQFVYKVGSKITGSPFNHSKEEIDKMAKNSNRKNSAWNNLEKKLKEAIATHINLSQTSEPFKRAFNRVWDEQIANSAKGNENYFGIAGLTYSGSVYNIIGALGEVQTALLGYYLQEICTGATPAFKSIISDPFISGEQLKADVIIAGAGIQVKNYGTAASVTGSKQKLNVNAHFDRLASFPAIGSIVNGFEEFLVNYYFNKSISDEGFNQILQALEYCFAEVASMDLNQSFDDKVTFYFLSGSYFLPASELLNALYVEQSIAVEDVSITSAYNGRTDEQYAQTEPKFYPHYGKQGRTKQRPNFIDYYAGDSLQYTKLGESTYNNIRKGISFRASIIYSSLLNPNFQIF